MKCYSYIRFSTTSQAKGRSKERQIEAAQKFADKEGWELDQSLSMFDEGMSAFHGEHTSTTGALGIFLAAVEEGDIPTPSALLVENLDRLSRDNVLKAFRQFTDILEAGITIVTMMDHRIYDFESVTRDASQLNISLGVMQRAHEESLTKQERRADTWQKGREDAKKGKIVKARCAAWLKISDDKTKFLLIKDRVAVVQRIYELYVDGHGFGSICRIFNQEGVPTFSVNYKNRKKKSTWGTTTIQRIITSRTVLGEMQFTKTAEVVNGKRKYIPVGEPITDYYPKIINEETFYKARKQHELRSGAFGKIGARNNLFTGIVKCGYCGATMQYGIRSQKKIKYLNCRDSVLGRPCHYASFRYQDLEDAFLFHCTKLRLQDIITGDFSEHEKHIKNLNSKLVAVNGMTAESEKKVSNYSKAISEVGVEDAEDTIQHFAGLIKDEKANQRKYNDRKEVLTRDIGMLANQHHEASTSLFAIQETIEHIADAEGDKRETIRRRLQKEIRALVERIDMYPHGRNYYDDKQLLENKDLTDDLREHYVNITGKWARKKRSCTVIFRGGGTLTFSHDPKTNGLAFSVETDEDGVLTQRTHDNMQELLRKGEQ